jgi:hypothetical protein
MAGEVTNINRGVSRKQYLQEFIDVKNEIFSETNLNKMESKLGTSGEKTLQICLIVWKLVELDL